MESFRDVLGESTVVNNLVMLHPARYISLVQFSPAQKKYRLDDWLDSKVIVINKNIFTPNEILRSVADKEADHYDLELPDKYLTLKNSMIETKDGKYNEVQIFLSQLGEIVVEWGRNLLEKFEQ